MRDLYKMTATEALQFPIDSLMERHPELTKQQAKDLVLNTLIYNLVIEEIVGQAEFLMEEE